MTAMPNISFRNHYRWFIFKFLLFTLAHFATAMASEITVQPDEEQILINFGDVNTDHRIYLDDKEIWFGRGESYLIENLTKDTLYTILVTGEDSATRAIFYTETLPDGSQAEHFLQSVAQDQIDDLFSKSHLNAEVFPDRIELDVGFIPSDGAALEVYRNGEKIGVIENHRYVDTHFEKNVEYDYEVHGLKRRNDSEIELTKSKLTEVGLELTEEVLEYISYDPYVLGRYGVRFADVGSENAKSREELETFKANSGPTYVLRYTTFIPWKDLGIPLTNIYGDGDDRGLSATSNRFRTRVDTIVSFKDGSVRSIGPIGPTILRDRGHGDKIICCKRAKASPKVVHGKNYMHLGQVWRIGDNITWNYVHSVKNPCVPAPTIDWDYQATVGRNGQCRIKITHDRSPAHEVYIARKEKQGSEKGWRKVYSYYRPGVSPSPNFWKFALDLTRRVKTDIRVARAP